MTMHYTAAELKILERAARDRLADQLGQIAGRSSYEADREVIIKATEVLRIGFKAFEENNHV